MKSWFFPGVAGAGSYGKRSVSGCAAGRDVRPAAHLLSLCRQRKVGKEKATPLAASFASLRAACDARAWGGAAELALRLPPLRSNSRSESEHEAWSCCVPMPAPRPALLGTARGDGRRRAIASLGPELNKGTRLVLAPQKAAEQAKPANAVLGLVPSTGVVPPRTSESAEGDSGGVPDQRRARACTGTGVVPSREREGASSGGQCLYGLPGCRSYRLGTPSRSRSPRGRLGWRS